MAHNLKGPSNSKTGIFLQDKCYQHAWIRTRDASHIFERPERLRAVKLGLAAAIAHIEEKLSSHSTDSTKEAEDELSKALENMKIATSDAQIHPSTPVSVILSNASVDLLNNPAVKFIHGDIDGDVYLQNLIRWAKDSRDNIAVKGTEIPEGFNQGDMYLCPESIDAIQGALGTICQAVDAVFDSRSDVNKAFVAIRPPGHHCGEDTPAGFCFVNNVAIGAAHAHLQHGAKRIVILDFDLHHGNGTQSIVWDINEETYRQTIEAEAGSETSKPGPQIYYGSLHDILSYPCEDGKISVVQAASTSLHGPHGQHIENIHLEPYVDEERFAKIYEAKYIQLITRAQKFLESSGGASDDVIVFISAGMDACEHENPAMSRHGRKVPVSFYHRFTQDVRIMADHYAGGRLVSVLEGGYSDRALISGSMAHLLGMSLDKDEENQDWWSVGNLEKIETKAESILKRKRGGRTSLQNTQQQTTTEPWLERIIILFTSVLDVNSAHVTIPKGSTPAVPPTNMTLRDRSKKPNSAAPSPNKDKEKGRIRKEEAEKRLPKVILKLGPKPEV